MTGKLSKRRNQYSMCAAESEERRQVRDVRQTAALETSSESGASPSAALHPSALPPFTPNNASVLPATLCRLFQRTSKKEKQIEAAGDNETAGYVKAVHFGCSSPSIQQVETPPVCGSK